MAMPFRVGCELRRALQLGVRDVACPSSERHHLLVDRRRRTAVISRWCGVSCATRLAFRTDELQFSTVSRTSSVGAADRRDMYALAGINMGTTILKLRAPGMGYMRPCRIRWTAAVLQLWIVGFLPVVDPTFGAAAGPLLGMHSAPHGAAIHDIHHLS